MQVDISEFKDILDVSWQTTSEIHWLIEQLIALQPKRVLEIGVAQGGTTGLFSRIVGPDGLVVALDITDDLVDPRVRSLENISFLIGDSHDPAMLEAVRAASPEYDFMLIDGDHSVDGVLQDTEMYLPLLREGGLVVWHDVRLDAGEGIKQVWYRDFRRKLLGSFEVYAQPYNNGYGVWQKTSVTVDAFEAGALQALKAGRGQVEDFRRILKNDCYRLKSWEALKALAEQTGDEALQREASVALALLPPHSPDCVRGLVSGGTVSEDPVLAAGLDALNRELAGEKGPAIDWPVAMAASAGGFHDVAEARIDRAQVSDAHNLGLLLDRIEILERSDALITDVVAAVADAVRVSAGTAREAGSEARLQDAMRRAFSACYLLQRYSSPAPLLEACLTSRSDLAPLLTEILLYLCTMTVKLRVRRDQVMDFYLSYLKRSVEAAGAQLAPGHRRNSEIFLSGAWRAHQSEATG
ncbi:MAG: class I SAM-dependent methyltransferase [Nisaea sp.]|uniref:CmcI family methyltransferase n=1 Tax=Nisaea sp. TaxID=2024842 RepID=UPI001B11C433|nr:CmcI family methyltransferase [Nisaea sp.]MBO6560627.1 class I SAM-dependent methyltransferase [Nisaea sp.]